MTADEPGLSDWRGVGWMTAACAQCPQHSPTALAARPNRRRPVVIHLSAANSLKGEDPTWRSRCPSRALAKFDSTVRCRFPVRASLTLAAFGQAKLLQWLVARPEHVVNSGERRGALDSHPEASPPTRSWNSTNGGASHEVLPRCLQTMCIRRASGWTACAGHSPPKWTGARSRPTG